MTVSQRFFAGFPWRMILTTLDGETVTSLERLAMNRTLTFLLNQPAQCKGQVPSDDPRVNVTDVEPGLDAPHLSYSDRLLYAFRREATDPDVWVCRFGGIVTQIEDAAQTEQPYSTFTAFDPWQYLFRRAIYTSDGDRVGKAGISWNDTAGNEIVRQLLDYTIAQDGTAFVSYDSDSWDTTADLTINIGQGTSVGDALRQLVATGSMDIEFRPVYDTAQPGVCCTVHVHAQMGDTQDAAIFAWGTTPTVQGVSSLLDGSQMANDVRFHNGQGGDPVTPATDATSISRYGEYVSERFFPAQTQDAAVEEFAQRSLLWMAYGKRTVTLSPNPLLSPRPFLDYGLGDLVPVYATTRLRQQIPWGTAPTVYQRVYGIPITLGDDGVEKVDRLIASPDGFS